MRLHRLSMTAIGPFVEPTEIDFSRLGAQGLFLLEGPTGSGKSTVIDAITFALFGHVAQASADDERLRSHHAAPHVVPTVELVFETQAGLFRVRRTPSYFRPKRSGTGLTKQNGTIKLWRLTSPDDTGSGEPLSTSFREADDEIRRAIGLSREQFVQTMVLPQGEFATFLKSGTDEKRSLLQKLFGTEVVARTEAALVEARRAAMLDRELAERTLDRAIHAFIAASGASTEDADLMTSSAPAQAVDVASSWVSRIAAERAKAVRVARSAARIVLSARRTHDAALDVMARRARRDALRKREAALTESAPVHARKRDELAAATRAAIVAPSAESLTDALRTLDAAHAAEAVLRDAVPQALAECGESQLDEALAERRTTVGTLREVVRVEHALLSLRRDIEAAAQESAALDIQLVGWRTELAELPSVVTTFAAERDVALQAAAQIDAIVAERARAMSRLDAARAAVRAEEAAHREQQVTEAAFAALEEHAARLAQLRATHRASIAAELGLALRMGERCQVCGSVEHPQPATPGHNYVSKEQVEAAEREHSDLSSRFELAKTQLEHERLRLAELRIAADQNPPEIAEARLADVERRLAQARESEQRIEEIDAMLAQAQATLAGLTELVQHAEVRQAELAQQVESAAAQLAVDEIAVAAQLDGFPTVSERLACVEAELSSIAAARDAALAVRVARDAAVQHAETFREVLAAQQFESEAQWRAAVRAPQQLDRLRAELRLADDETAAVAAGLAEPALLDPALDDDPPDVAALAEAVAAAEAASVAAEHSLASVSDRLDAATIHVERLRQAVADGAAVLDRTAPAIRLGNLVSGLGDNRLRMELTTYVLTRRFAEVIASANAQLRNICDGRYELEHTEARSGNARSGLGLNVHDHFTGVARDPKTLSGGEAFYVALALALGLADVVRSESGGVDMGTLFIDEGFGSLDPTTLDEVMTVLDGLRAGGRAVGIVSHVQELKTRIPDRIEIIPRADRSSTLRVIA